MASKKPLTNKRFFCQASFGQQGFCDELKIKTCHLVDDVYNSFPRRDKAAEFQEALKKKAGDLPLSSIFGFL